MEDFKVIVPFIALPSEYTCDGEDISPEIEIRGIDGARTKCLAIMVNDPNAPHGDFIHWIAWNITPTNRIPAGIPKVPAVTSPVRAVQGKNSFGRIGYGGPCPPIGQTHRYNFKVYGLDAILDLSAGATKKDLVKAMEGHVVQFGDTYVTYGR